MGINTSFHRLFADPPSRNREILQADLMETEDSGGGNATPSFLNTLAGDLDTRVIAIHKNTDQRLIVVTQDKTLLTLKRNIASLGKREWIAPLSTLSTIFIALLTSNFKQALGLGPAEWRAIFIVCGFITIGWLTHAMSRSIGAKSFHEVVRDICYELGARQHMTPVPVQTGVFPGSTMVAACKVRAPGKNKKKRGSSLRNMLKIR